MMRSGWLALGLLAACKGGTDSDGDSDDSDPPIPEAACTEPEPPACEDAMVLDLALHDDLVSEGEVTTTTDGEDFVTEVDASAGGFGNETQNPWVYVRFTPQGAERVDIDDETALGSMEWHVAARRFILRLNGGDSGPSCVGAAAFLEREYADLTEIPDGITYVEDDYYTGDCTIVNDSSGLPGSPQVALGPWWSYPGCVATTDVPFLLRLEDGSVIRWTVERYYEEGQETCNETGDPGSGSGNFVWRWKYLAP